MKKSLSISFLIAVVLSLPLAGFSRDLKEMKKECEGYMTISAVSSDDFEDENDNEFIVLKFECELDSKLPSDMNYALRVTVQITDKKTDAVIYAQFEQSEKPAPPNRDITPRLGIYVPLDQMERPKVTAYAVELGVLDDGQFIPVEGKYDDVNSAEEIIEAGGSEVKLSKKDLKRIKN